MPKPSPKQPKDAWRHFLKQVTRLAVEVGIASNSYRLVKLQHKTGKRSQAWKSFERAIANMAEAAGFEAKRISRGADLGASDIDVRLHRVPELQIDCKYRQDGFSHHSLFEGAERLYCTRPEQWLALPTKAGQATGSLITLRSEKFFELLARAYPEKTKAVVSWSCPRCQSETQHQASYLAFNLYERQCHRCQLSFWLSDEQAAPLSSDFELVEVLLPS